MWLLFLLLVLLNPLLLHQMVTCESGKDMKLLLVKLSLVRLSHGVFTWPVLLRGFFSSTDVHY